MPFASTERLPWSRKPVLRQAWLALVLAGLALGRPAAAQEAEQNQAQAAAESLFLEGRKLMVAGKIEEACERFAESRHIDPAIGTTMNLARCYLKLGRTASAWLLYRDTAATARSLGQADREKHARRELAALEPDLAKLVVEPEPALVSDARVEVLLDGSRIPSSMLGSELPVDPGAHQLVVRTPRGELWTGQVVAVARHTEHLPIPHLDVPADSVEPSVAPAPAPPSPPASRSSVPANDSTAAPRGLTSRRKAALTFAGVAALSAGYAVFETVRAVSANASSSPDTCKRGATCDAASIQNRERAFDSARRADVAAGISAVCLVNAGVLWLLGAPREQRFSAELGRSAVVLGYRDVW